MRRKLAVVNLISLTVLAGSLVGFYIVPFFSAAFFLVSSVFLLFLAFGFRQDLKMLKLFFFLLIFLLALFRANVFLNREPIQGEITIRGKIAEVPMWLSGVQTLTVETEKGPVLVKTAKYPLYSYGDILEISGNFRKGRGSYSQVAFPKIVRIKTGGNNFLGSVFSWRENFRAVLLRIFPEPEGSLASGMILGSGNLGNSRLVENLRTTGTSHIVSVSGFNISIIIVVLINSLVFVSTKVLIPLLVLIVLIFDLMVGFTPSVLRATIMGFFLLLAKIVGRQGNMTDALVLSAATISFLDPRSLASLGFWLSFSSLAGIVYFYPFISGFFKDWPRLIGEPLGVTFAAQLGVLPFVIYSFGTVSLISPLANLLVGWTIPSVMALTFLTGFFGQFLFPLGNLFGALDLVLLTYFVKVIEVLAKIPYASVKL